MYSTEILEHRILEWYITHYHSHKKPLTAQISSSTITEREFTHGVGVFVSFVVQDKRYKLHNAVNVAQLEGPCIKSPELEYDASVGLGINHHGIIDYLEIWAHNYDYPLNRHVNAFELTLPDVNVIDLRSE